MKNAGLIVRWLLVLIAPVGWFISLTIVGFLVAIILAIPSCSPQGCTSAPLILHYMQYPVAFLAPLGIILSALLAPAGARRLVAFALAAIWSLLVGSGMLARIVAPQPALTILFAPRDGRQFLITGALCLGGTLIAGFIVHRGDRAIRRRNTATPPAPATV